MKARKTLLKTSALKRGGLPVQIATMIHGGSNIYSILDDYEVIDSGPKFLLDEKEAFYPKLVTKIRKKCPSIGYWPPKRVNEVLVQSAKLQEWKQLGIPKFNRYYSSRKYLRDFRKLVYSPNLQCRNESKFDMYPTREHVDFVRELNFLTDSYVSLLEHISRYKLPLNSLYRRAIMKFSYSPGATRSYVVRSNGPQDIVLQWLRDFSFRILNRSLCDPA
jgi:hypothetical protein